MSGNFKDLRDQMTATRKRRADGGAVSLVADPPLSQPVSANAIGAPAHSLSTPGFASGNQQLNAVRARSVAAANQYKPAPRKAPSQAKRGGRITKKGNG